MVDYDYAVSVSASAFFFLVFFFGASSATPSTLLERFACDDARANS